ncbi:ABC transporter permease [Methylobacillus sp. MM3]|jgi:lipopolysaccharide transport system permease protein|uniref:ABC transporter permease n=1 Tax=Methylobacillus sp. MM3 TaxID=1848039 RepID=UPI000AD4EBA2|nr:ABC transporter permease [Methylobacillus sp. MM3]
MANTLNSENQFTLVIEAGRADRHYWLDIWRYRDLFFFLVWRDILVRYKQTVIGIAWVVIRPILTMLVFTLVFGKLAKLPSEGVPYSLMVFSGMLPWFFFSSALSESSNSMVTNSNLLSKIYFPRIIVPISAIIVCLVDFFLSFLVLVPFMFYYGLFPDWKVITIPFFLLLAIMASLGCGLWLSALNIKYRDFRFILPFIVQIGLYVSPVGFSSNIVPEKWRLLYSVNPMVGVIDGFRWALLGGNFKLYLPGLYASIVLTLIVFMTGLSYFRRTERTFADLL